MRNLNSLNKRSRWILLSLGVVVAILWAPVAIAVATTINFLTSNSEWADAMARVLRDPAFLVFCILIGPIVEEILFRKLWLGSLLRENESNAFRKIMLVAVAFGVLHWYPSLMVPAFAGGVFFGYLYYWSGSVIPPICAHIAYNATYILVLLAIPDVSNALVTGQPTLLPYGLVATCLVCVAVALQFLGKYTVAKTSTVAI